MHATIAANAAARTDGTRNASGSISGHPIRTMKKIIPPTRTMCTPEMDKTAAAVARLPKVRAVLVARQRALGEQGGVVMEGRDIGTVVFPNAQLKIYLDAS